MKKSMFLLAAAAIILSATSCVKIVNDHRNEVHLTEFDKEEIDTILPIEHGFEGISVGGKYDVTLIQDTVCGVRFHGKRALAKNVEISYTDTVLLFSNEHPRLLGGHLYVSMPKLASLEVCGAAEVECKNWNQDSDLGINVSGAGELEFEYSKFGNIDYYCSGYGDLEMKRVTAENVKLTVTGSANIDVKGIKANDLFLYTSGSADVKLSGEVHSFTPSTNGSASIDQRGLVIK